MNALLLKPGTTLAVEIKGRRMTLTFNYSDAMTAEAAYDEITEHLRDGGVAIEIGGSKSRGRSVCRRELLP